MTSQKMMLWEMASQEMTSRIVRYGVRGVRDSGFATIVPVSPPPLPMLRPSLLTIFSLTCHSPLLSSFFFSLPTLYFSILRVSKIFYKLFLKIILYFIYIYFKEYVYNDFSRQAERGNVI